MHSSLCHLDHRPWPLPRSPWFLKQSWCDLLFIHWPVPAGSLRHLVPPQLEIQEYDGTSWVSIVPFIMKDVAPRWIPSVPILSEFPELNLRLYVSYQGKQGVWFLSLDATSSLAVYAGRSFFNLPYHRADIDIKRDESLFHYSSRRLSTNTAFIAAYGTQHAPLSVRNGSLEEWLTERYCLYAAGPDGKIRRTEVHHKKWPIMQASVEIITNELFLPHGIAVNGPPALAHFSERVDVITWLPQIA